MKGFGGSVTHTSKRMVMYSSGTENARKAEIRISEEGKG